KSMGALDAAPNVDAARARSNALWTTLSGPVPRTAAARDAALRLCSSSARFPKFVIKGGTLTHELRKAKGTSKLMFLVPLFDLRSLGALAASDAGTSTRRH